MVRLCRILSLNGRNIKIRTNIMWGTYEVISEGSSLSVQVAVILEVPKTLP